MKKEIKKFIKIILLLIIIANFGPDIINYIVEKVQNKAERRQEILQEIEFNYSTGGLRINHNN